MNYKIILIILLILFLLGNYFRESFIDTETPTHYLLNSSIQTTTFQLTNIISRSASGDKEDDFKNLYTPFGKEHFDQNADYEQGQLPILVLESYKECPTLHTLYKSLKKLKTGGYEQNENVEGYRFRSLIQSVFYNITEPIEVDYKLFDMFVKDKFKEDLSNNQPNLKLKLYEQDINNNILINRLNSIKGPGIQEITYPGTLFTLHDHFELKITINITDDSSPESILFITDDEHKGTSSYIDEIRSSIDFYINDSKLNIGINDKNVDKYNQYKRSYIIVENDGSDDGSDEYVITIKKQSNRIEVKKDDNNLDGVHISKYRFMKNASDLRTGGVFHIYTGSNYGTNYTISNFSYKELKFENNNNILINRLNSIKGPGIQEITYPETLFTLHDHFELKITINIKDYSSNERILFITDDEHKGTSSYIDKIRSSIDFYINDGKLYIGINNKALSRNEGYNSYIIVEKDSSNEYVITIKKQSNRIEVTKGDDPADKLFGQGISKHQFMKYASALRTGGVFHIYTGSNYETSYKISNFSYRQLNTELSYLDSVQPQYSFNHKEATFGVQENFERIDILRFMDFAFTTLCWGALHINLLKPLDNHFYAFPCQNKKCNTTYKKPHFFYLLPVKVRQICYEEGSEYTRAKCNGCASNIIVFFNQVPTKFKNLSNINSNIEIPSLITPS